MVLQRSETAPLYMDALPSVLESFSKSQTAHDDLPCYSEMPLVQTLYLSKSEKVGDSIITNVSTNECSDYFTAVFSIDLDVSDKVRVFKVIPSGRNINPEAENDFYYSFTMCEGHERGTGFFRMDGGRGMLVTPCQVVPYPAFVSFGMKSNFISFARFLNPFKSGTNLHEKPFFQNRSIINGYITRYEWVLQYSHKGNYTFGLRQWDEQVNAVVRKMKSSKTTSAEFHVSDDGAKLFATGNQQLWSTVEECAFVVGTAYCAYLTASSN
ncbi:hypothetical protein HDU83_009333 [Entophlyctis luteolus]|nr:hypothetical protein HDU83_009333 [Entophlyctis luteolus]KAJ3388957.1 hypothetical protein HDU84_009281 [Entophlyctis sp. JEL0112]